MKKKKTKNKKRQKKRTIDLGFGDFSAFLPGKGQQNTEDNFETLRNKMNQINIPSKRPNNKFYNINNAGVVQDTRDFVYTDGKIVPRGTPYHIHIDPDTKKETYMTGGIHQPETEIIIRVRGATLLGQFVKIRGNNAEQDYLSEYQWSPKKKDIKRGFSIRYFVKEGFGQKRVFEISDTDADKGGRLYEKINLDWEVGYNQKLVFDKNTENLKILDEAGFGDLLDELDAFDGFLGDENPLMTKLLELANKNEEEVIFDPQDFGGKKKVKKGGKKKKTKKKKSGMGSSGGTQGGSSGGSSGGGSGGGGGAY